MVASVNNILEVQPASCRTPLPYKKIEWSEWHLERPQLISKIERVLFYDPTNLYNKIHPLIDPYKRHPGLQMEQLFPKVEDTCACGCGKGFGKYRSKWATDECTDFAGDVLSIINNYWGKPLKYTKWYYGNDCIECGQCKGQELDHIVGVKHGGGGAWLSNYRWLCCKCHRNKTNKDFGFKGMAADKNQMKIEI